MISTQRAQEVLLPEYRRKNEYAKSVTADNQQLRRKREAIAP